MQCPKHPRYKGKTDTKRDCEHCKAIRAGVLKKAKERRNQGRGQQMSLTTPGFRCGLLHVLAEMGTIMLYGPQPKFFWRQEVNANPKAKEHFKNMITMLVGYQKRDQSSGKNLLQEVRGLLWLVFGRDYANMKAEELRNEKYEILEEEQEEAAVLKENVDRAKTANFKKSSRRSLLDLMEENDGEAQG